jgi:Pro-kumamolisin, activation domain/Bacterial Ig-like domain (group 3)
MNALLFSALRRSCLFTILAMMFGPISVAQQPSIPQEGLLDPASLITRAIDETQLTVLRGNTHPLARPEFDLGTAPATLPMQRMLLVLKRSPKQESELRKLLDDQQDKASPNYHKWLTPEQFGKQFGPGDSDIQTITSWLQSHGFQVGSTKGRTVMEFSGSASQVQEAFHTTIHKYVLNGEQHWANANDPSIPTALTPGVAGLSSLNNFPRRPMNRFAGQFTREKATGKVSPVSPLFTFQPGFTCSADTYCFALGPYDFATIYNVLPLWNSNIHGTGQTIAIVGESNIDAQDVANFRTLFGLPANNSANGNPLNIILNGPDPGPQADESEADIDVQWSGAVAPYATIDFVVSESTETTSGIDLSAVYIVDNNLAPVMSESYGVCELGLGTAGNQFYNTLWQQAAAQGITVFISAGDNGAAGCDDFGSPSPAPAQFGLQVSGFASTPYNVAVGGTDFNEFTNPTAYWSTTNNSTTQASALGYIPEGTWNDSCTNAIWETISGLSPNPETNCNNLQLNDVVPVGGSGGKSNCTTPNGSAPENCAGGYSKPTWQSGSGVPNDGKRDLPDVSLFASNGFAGSFYVICQSDQQYGSCNSSDPNQNFLGFGGTSVSSPAFAGIMALVNQQTGSRQGNANYVFYKLAAKQSGSNCNSTTGPAGTCVFNDITSGTIAMPCATGTANCNTSTIGDAYGILTGYGAGPGYDLATGLGSVNANNLVTQWNSVTSLPSTTTLNSLAPTTITHGQPVNFSVTVKPQSGTGTNPTGEISLLGGSGGTSPASVGLNLSGGAASGTTDLLPGGTYSVVAHYPGDGTYSPSNSNPISVTVGKENSLPQIFLVTFDSSNRILSSNTTTAPYGTPYILRVNVDNSSGQPCAPASATGPTACPTGTVTLTNNGTTLDAGTYTLNSYGYFEDLIVQLPGGTDSVTAAYTGDNSFNASSATTSIAITPAITTMTVPNVSGASVGQPAQMSVYVNTTSSGAAPSGTVTFYANGTAIKGTVSYSAIAGGLNNSAYLLANLTSDTSAFPTAGSYAITATYNGDPNYSTATSSADNITVMYPAPNVVVTPTQQTSTYGSTATITALVDTTNKVTYPTGTVTFVDAYSGVTVSGPAACAKATDTGGNFACQVSGSFTVTSSDPINAKYSGDANYPASSTWAFITMPDFMVSPQGGVSLTAGQSQNVTISIQSSNAFSGTVSNFTCSGLPAEATCSFTPGQVTLSSNGSVSTTLTVSTKAIGQASSRAVNDGGGRRWGVTQAMFLLGACLIGIPLSRRRGRISIALMLACVFVVLPSCGGGSGGGGGGGTPNPVPSISSLNPAQIAAGSQIQNLYVNGSNFLSSSTVTYNGTLHNSALQSNNQIQIALGPADVATTGQYPVVVTNPSPGGGASTPVNFAVVTGTPTGNFYVTLTATSGPITHSTTLSMNVQ